MLKKILGILGTAVLVTACGGSGSSSINGAAGTAWTVGGMVSGLPDGTSVVLRNNNGDVLMRSSNGSFTFATAVTGTYAVTVDTHPQGAWCVVTNGTGTATANVSDVAVTCSLLNYAYVTNSDDGTVSAYSQNPVTGALVSVGAAVPSGTGAVWATVDSTRKYMVVANSSYDVNANKDTSTITTFSINGTTGALTRVDSSSFASPVASPAMVNFHPSGEFVYNVGYKSVSILNFDAATGTLTASSASPITTSGVFTAIGLDSSGQYAWVSSALGASRDSPGTLTGYKIDQTGAMSTVAGVPRSTGQSPNSVAVSPSGEFVFAANMGSGTVSVFKVGTDGAPTEVGTPVTAGRTPMSVQVSPSGNFVYVVNTADNTVSGYTLDASSGVLTAITGSPFKTGSSPYGASFDPAGGFLYVTNQGDKTVSAFAVNATTGALKEAAGSPYATGTSPSMVTIAKHQ